MPKGRPKVERITVTCAACGRAFDKRRSDAARNKSGRFFCSTECLRKVGPKPRRRTNRRCEWCDSEFYPQTDADQRFCSKDCYDAWQRRNRIEKVCERCGETFWVKRGHVAHLTGRWCSRACEAASRIKRPLDREHNGRPVVLDNAGYVRISEPDHPKAMNGGWVFEHRYVMERFLGRQLAQHEHVHHINGKKDDNRLENLVVMDHLEHLVLSGAEHRTAIAEMQDELAAYRERFGPLEE